MITVNLLAVIRHMALVSEGRGLPARKLGTHLGLDGQLTSPPGRDIFKERHRGYHALTTSDLRCELTGRSNEAQTRRYDNSR